MLILVAGVTGNLGQKLVPSLTSRGHQVRGLGRNASKLPHYIADQLERFETSSSYDDIKALDRACQGADAVICAYGMDPRLQLEGQLLLLRAAERAEIKIFIGASWNGDWSKLELGKHEAYDAYISFKHQAEMTSTIKPIYIYIGIFAETLFSTYGHGHVGPDMPLTWNQQAKSLDIWGTGHTIWYWTTEQDAADFTAEIIQRDDASHGGFWNVCSGAHSLRQVAQIYEQERGLKVSLNIRGSIDDLRTSALNGRSAGEKRNFHRYTGLFYQLYGSDGTFNFPKLDNDKLPVTPTSLPQFLSQNPHI
ncbi:hypothetical protein BFJ63_vAg15094 [Fusarium oxysporum f. sp. narcissi]|uniref:NmrA-like domain-containing protein n=4 Tax=Fusarium oxysporum TaxID=5507 RepID=A0A2H3GEU1_FUSOX|nr:hypothetical protein AU210_012520 [Fusarium oxysporum f. sp. radicis-cucumerinum]RKK10298.1 hypothetical protein BFJ65_g15596 [Fusarium oxysporum f. sp. cepae]RKK84505.1 hypothetical protein BFJ71_g14552 [Fusarium oxysporum]RYC82026.1 hypothetical protein BFJ63_vAg15094 [Fusarium oxysporum f. sp. narcissi]RKK30705.1 hypothetical protein BFJ66_g16187 [Fusarium oxysporum f. sp. cepae]